MDEKTRRIRESYLAAFDTDHGRIVLEHLAKLALYDNCDFCPDARKADFLAGRRSMVACIRNILNGGDGNAI